MAMPTSDYGPTGSEPIERAYSPIVAPTRNPSMCHTRMPPAASLVLVAGLLVVLGGCRDMAVEPETPYSGPVEVSVTAASTPFVLCGKQVPVMVTVTGTNGEPVSGFHLNFNVLEGGGRMFGGAALTNRRGVARDIWTVGGGARGRNTLAVRAVDPASGVGTTYFTQTVTALGRIAFASTRDGVQGLHVMNPDGSNVQLLLSQPGGAVQPTMSADGSRIAFVSNRGSSLEIYGIDADGSNVQRLTDHPARDEHPALSPDAGRIAFTSDRDGNPEIYVMNADGSNVQRLTTHPARDRNPVWSPDGSKIAFISDRDPPVGIYVMNADGSNLQRLTDGGIGILSGTFAWSPDGSRIAFASERDEDFNTDIYVMNPDGSDVQRLTTHPALDGGPTWSPDGRGIAFLSQRDGNLQIYVMFADGSNQRNVTNHPGSHGFPTWGGCPAL